MVFKKCKMQNAKCKMQIVIFIGIAMLLCSINSSFAYTPSRLQSTSIDTLFITGGSNIGDTINVTTRIKSLISTNIKYGFIFSCGVKPVSLPDSIHSISFSQFLDSGNTVQKTISLIITDTLANIAVNTNLKPLAKLLDFEPMNLIQGKILTLFGNTTLNLENPNSDDDLTICTDGEALSLPALIDGEQTVNLEISGKVLFVDPTDNRTKGAITKLRLYLKPKFNPELPVYSLLRLPQPLLNNEYIKGVHWTETDSIGNYSFFVKASAEAIKDLVYIVVVEKENFAIKLISPSNHISINPLRTNTPNFRVFDSYRMREARLTNPITGETSYRHENIDIFINPADGFIFRYASLSKYFLKRRFDVQNYSQLPFNTNTTGDKIPQIITNRFNTLKTPGGSFNTDLNYHTFQLNNNYIAHEYGHYFNWILMNALADPSCENYEGFPIFFSQAFRAWNNGTFCEIYHNLDEKDSFGNTIFNKGEEIYLSYNTEVAPSYKQWDIYNPFPNGYQKRGLLFSSNRSWLETTDGGYSGGAFSCFLWGLYDMKCEPDHKFTADCILSYAPYEDSQTILYYSKGRDNEDIELGKAVFELWVQNPFLNMEQFKNIIINQPNINIDAVNNYYNYLNTMEQENLVKPNPPSPNSIYVNTISRTINIFSGSYLDANAKQYYEYFKNSVKYASHEWDFGNQEKQCLIYNNNSLISTLNISANDYNNGVVSVPYSSIGAYNTSLDVKANRYYPIQNVNRTSSTAKTFFMPMLKHIEFESSDLNFSAFLYPNPCESNTTLNINSSFVSDFNLKIIDVLGNQVYYQNNTFFKGNNSININVNNLTSGQYTIIIDFNDLDNIKHILELNFIKY